MRRASITRAAVTGTVLIAIVLAQCFHPATLGPYALAGSQRVTLNAPNISQDKPLDCEAASLQVALAVAA